MFCQVELSNYGVEYFQMYDIDECLCFNHFNLIIFHKTSYMLFYTYVCVFFILFFYYIET